MGGRFSADHQWPVLGVHRGERNKREISTTLARDDCGNLKPATSLLQELYIQWAEFFGSPKDLEKPPAC
jgi:hypothetical protein